MEYIIMVTSSDEELRRNPAKVFIMSSDCFDTLFKVTCLAGPFQGRSAGHPLRGQPETPAPVLVYPKKRSGFSLACWTAGTAPCCPPAMGTAGVGAATPPVGAGIIEQYMIMEGNIRLLMFAMQDVIVGPCLAKTKNSANICMGTLLLWLDLTIGGLAAFSVQDILKFLWTLLFLDPTMTTQDTSQSQASSWTKMQVGPNESSPEPMTATPSVSWQTQGSPSTHLTLGHTVSTPGPDFTTQDFKQTTEEDMSNLTFVKYEILLPGAAGNFMEKNITLENATRIELSCRLDNKYSHLKSLQVTWKRGKETIRHINKTKNSWSIQLKISDNSKLGNYSCTLKGEEEIGAMFRLQVPKIDGKEKPLISYEGDTAVMICTSGYTPISWTWYMNNGSEQIAIKDSLLADKYVINTISANITHLKILKVTKEDDGVYWCEAAFELGKSKGKLKLKVLSYMVPLKPFLAIMAEVVILLTIVFLYEMYSKKKEKRAEDEKEFDQIEQLKSEESNGLENSSTRHRRI
ncbi:PREDICTED: embigin [Chaetura pelagica]|uniref:embigin n=1 Tax=Chaetura pelagica TaxID=8897 RepID=UPI000523BE28|nr:PREDICTED: embigin [Chaetura pelagica]